LVTKGESFAFWGLRSRPIATSPGLMRRLFSGSAWFCWHAFFHASRCDCVGYRAVAYSVMAKLGPVILQLNGGQTPYSQVSDAYRWTLVTGTIFGYLLSSGRSLDQLLWVPFVQPGVSSEPGLVGLMPVFGWKRLIFEIALAPHPFLPSVFREVPVPYSG